MATLDVDSLLEPNSEENPCGPNLEYDGAFVSLEDAARGKAELQYGDTIIPAEEPDWNEVRRRGIDLVSQTKDLRVGCLLARCLLETEGLQAFAESLALIRGYLQRYWQFVHPQLDPDDDNDPTLRVNTVASLSDQSTTIRLLNSVPIVDARMLGRYSLRDLGMATGTIPTPPDAETPTLEAIEGAFMGCDLERLKADAAAVRDCLAHAEAIETTLTDQVGSAQATSFDSLRGTLQEILKPLEEYVSRRDVTTTEDSPEEMFQEIDETTGDGPPGGIRARGEIRSRDDVVAALDKICDYYDRWEPSSPLPLLLQRAKRLATKNFLEIVRDLTPEALAQIQALGGVDGDDSDD